MAGRHLNRLLTIMQWCRTQTGPSSISYLLCDLKESQQVSEPWIPHLQFEGDNPYVSRVGERMEWGSRHVSQWSITFSRILSNELHGFEANILRLTIKLLHLLIVWSLA